ncbi:hypothetical protein DVH05_010034 [Phytophthora capsici]|nr:hypothetical protein DVH05_010034 [Phytophthora capsici]
MDVAASHRWLRVEVATASSEDASALAQASAIQLALTGMLFGLIHVLTGPDHLSALATLSAGSSWRSFALGIRWGCGHSIGLIVMAVIFIALDGKLDFSVLNVVTDVLVGVFMIALGIYGVHEGVKKSRQSRRRGASRRKRKSESDKKDAGIQESESEDEVDDETETESVASPNRTLLKEGEAKSSDEVVVKFSDEKEMSPSARRRLEALKTTKKAMTEDALEDPVMVDVSLNGQVSPRPHSVSVDTISLENSPCESVVALEELLSDRSPPSEETEPDIDGTKRDTGPMCCGFKLPTIDFQNAQTQKVRPTDWLGRHFHPHLTFVRFLVYCAVSGNCARDRRAWRYPRCTASRWPARYSQVVHIFGLVLCDVHRDDGSIRRSVR